MSLLDVYAGPGMGTEQVTTEREFLWGPLLTWQLVGILVDSAAADSGSSPTTTLRKGLPMGRVTSTGLFKQYDPTAADGTEVPVGWLWGDHNTLDQFGNARTGNNRLLIGGMVKAAAVLNLDGQVRRAMANRVLFDDLQSGGPGAFGGGLVGDYPVMVAKTADYTLVAGDNGRWFTNRGAVGAVNFTLPALATAGRGFRAKFSVEADQTVTVTAPSGKLVAFNNAAATSIAFSTASEKVGGTVEIAMNDNASKYLAVVHLGTETQTPVIA